MRARVSCEAASNDPLDPVERRQLAELRDHLVRAGLEAASRLSARDCSEVDAEAVASGAVRSRGLAGVEESLLAATDSLAVLRATPTDADLADRICVELLHAASVLPTDESS